MSVCHLFSVRQIMLGQILVGIYISQYRCHLVTTSWPKFV